MTQAIAGAQNAVRCYSTENRYKVIAESNSKIILPCGCTVKPDLRPLTLCAKGAVLFERSEKARDNQIAAGNYSSSWQLEDDAQAWFAHFKAYNDRLLIAVDRDGWVQGLLRHSNKGGSTLVAAEPAEIFLADIVDDKPVNVPEGFVPVSNPGIFVKVVKGESQEQ